MRWSRVTPTSSPLIRLGLSNVVGTLGTALGEDHLRALERLADRVVLVYDADAAGQNAADRALEFFLGSDLDLRVLTLPANLDPCDYLLEEGAERVSRAGRAGGRPACVPARSSGGSVSTSSRAKARAGPLNGSWA